MRVTASQTTTTITVCGGGQLRGGAAIAPTWQMDSVSTGGTFPAQQRWEVQGRTFHHCFSGPKTANSVVKATLTYIGAGDDYPSMVFGLAMFVNGGYDELELSH